MQGNLRPTQTTGTGPRRQPRDRGRHAPAAGGPLEPVGPVPPPHRTPPNHHLPGLRQHRVPSGPMPGVRRGGGHPTARHAAVPVPRWSSPPRAGLHIWSAIRPTTRRRVGGLGRRLPLVPEPFGYAPALAGAGGTTTTTTTGGAQHQQLDDKSKDLLVMCLDDNPQLTLTQLALILQQSECRRCGRRCRYARRLASPHSPGPSRRM